LVTDLERLSKALSDDTPEKLAEREITKNADKIAYALETTGVYEDAKLGLRISADNGRAAH
jgi:hypothetical protein